MYHDCTGYSGVVGCRYGFADCDAWGFGFVARDTWTGNIDAPDFMPQGSVKALGTIRHSPQMTHANRNVLTGHAYAGTHHDA